MADMNVAIQIVGTDSASGPISKISTSLGQLMTAANQSKSAVSSFGSALDNVATIAAGVTIGQAVFQGIRDVIGAAEDSIIGFNARLQQSEITWSQFLGSDDAANQMLTTLQQFASVTPFRFQTLEEGARTLLSMGTAADQILPELKDIATAAAASPNGAAGFQNITYALAEMQANGRVDARIMRELTMDSVPAWEILAQSMGKSVEQVRALSQAGQLSSDTFMTAFHDWVQNHEGDLLAKQAQTFTGALTTLEDNLQIVAATASRPIFDRLAADLANAGEASITLAQGPVGGEIAADLTSILDAMDRTTTTIVDDTAVWIEAFNRVDEAISKIHMPDLAQAAGLGAQESSLQALAKASGISGVNLLTGTASSVLEVLPLIGPQVKLLATVTDQLAASEAQAGQNTDYFRDAIENTTSAADKHTNAMARLSQAAQDSGNAATVAAADWKALESALGGQSDVLTLAVSTDPAVQAMNDNLAAMQDHLTALKDAQTAAAAAGSTFKGAIESQIPGLQAFDAATFGLQQHLSGVQLEIEQRKLSRMEARPGSGRPEQEAALLQEELKVRGLQRDVTFGGALHQAQLEQPSTTAVRSTETVAIKAQEDAITATKNAITAYTDALKEQDKVTAAITPTIAGLLPYLQQVDNLLALTPATFQSWVTQFGPDEAAKQSQYRNQAIQLGVVLPAEVAAVAAQGGDINAIPGIGSLQENQPQKRRGGIQGFASGGSFTVGGSGGTDSQLVQFFATPGEPVSVGAASQTQGGNLTINGPLVQIQGNATADDAQRIGEVVDQKLRNLIAARAGVSGRVSGQLAGVR